MIKKVIYQNIYLDFSLNMDLIVWELWWLKDVDGQR